MVDIRLWLHSHYKSIGEAVGLDLVRDEHEPNLFYGHKSNFEAGNLNTPYRIYLEVFFDYSDTFKWINFLGRAESAKPNLLIWICCELRHKEQNMMQCLNKLIGDQLSFIGVELKMIRDKRHSMPQFTPVILPPNWKEP